MLWVMVMSAPIVVYGQLHAVGREGCGSGSKEMSKGRAEMSLGVRKGSSVWMGEVSEM